jgi:hypothetical protein
LQCGPAVKIGELAAQAEFRKHKQVVRLGKHLFCPTGIRAQIDADVEAVLPHDQNAAAGIVPLDVEIGEAALLALSR